MEQHKYDLRTDSTNSSLVQHRTLTGHFINPNNSTPIINIKNIQKRKFGENFYINTNKNFNKVTGEFGNDLFLNNLLRDFRIFPKFPT